MNSDFSHCFPTSTKVQEREYRGKNMDTWNSIRWKDALSNDGFE